MLEKFIYRSYSLTSSLKHWMRQRFTNSGRFVLVCLAASTVLGVTPNKTLAFQLFTFLLSIVGISMAFSRFFKGRFTVARALPRFTSVGEPIFYTLTIRNETGTPQKGLFFADDLEDPRPTHEEFMTEEEPDESKRNPWDRKMKYYRWLWLIRLRQRAEVREIPLPVLPPKKNIQIKVELNPLRRGYLRFAGVAISRPDPFGLFKSRININAEQSLLILPKIYRTPPLHLPGRRKHNQRGVALASNVGDSEEFVALRDYKPGDPLRNIHWKSWAKLGKPIVKEFQEEFFSRHALVLDTFAQADGTDQFEEAVSAAASFVSQLELKESLLDLMFVGAKAYCFTAGRSLGHTDQMLEILASVKAVRDQPFGFLQSSVISRASLLNGCICIFLTWDEDRKNLVARLKSLGVSLQVMIVAETESEAEVFGNDPGPMKGDLQNFHVLEVGNIEEGLNKL